MLRVPTIVVGLLIVLSAVTPGALSVWTTRISHGGTPPTSWGSADATCFGQQQSPIDILAPSTDWNLRPLHPIYPSVHQVQLHVVPRRRLCLQLQGTRGYLFDNNAGATQYTLDSIDVVSPSDHRIGGSAFDVELQLVHTATGSPRGSDPRKLVMSVLLRASDNGYNYAVEPILLGNENTTDVEAGLAAADARFAAAMANGSATDEEILRNTVGAWNTTMNRTVDLSHFLGVTRDYYTYRGSLTKPPCSEDVTWVIFADPSPVGTSQVSALRTMMGLSNDLNATADFNVDGNNRPVQETPNTPYPTTIVDDESRPVLIGTVNGKTRRMTDTEVRAVKRFKDVVGDEILLARPGVPEANSMAIDFAWASLGMCLASIVLAALSLCWSAA